MGSSKVDRNTYHPSRHVATLPQSPHRHAWCMEKPDGGFPRIFESSLSFFESRPAARPSSLRSPLKSIHRIDCRASPVVALTATPQRLHVRRPDPALEATLPLKQWLRMVIHHIGDLGPRNGGVPVHDQGEDVTGAGPCGFHRPHGSAGKHRHRPPALSCSIAGQFPGRQEGSSGRSALFNAR